MTVTAWRIVKARHAATAFTGEGAARTGGRWNSRGVRMVYASTTLSLAALETLVHLNPPVQLPYVCFPIELDADGVETVPSADLPPEWRDEPGPVSTRLLGDRWVAAARTVALRVPSVIIPSEFNILLNPQHPDFGRLTLGPAQPFSFDPRLI
jgi:RES domain-containing protein